jgi:uncharacterized damage-inducible protein DinB
MLSPYMTASLAVLDEMYDDLVALIGPLDEACLNWTPLPADTNSIASMTVHIVGATEGWFARALEEPLVRDRDAEFSSYRTAAQLLDLIAASRRRTRDLAARVDQLDPTREHYARRALADRSANVSVAWCVQHALIHAGEHWGQIQLTKQLYAAR